MFNHFLQSGKAQMAETEQAPLPPYTQNALITRRVSWGGSRGFKSLSEREEIVGRGLQLLNYVVGVTNISLPMQTLTSQLYPEKTS